MTDKDEALEKARALEKEKVPSEDELDKEDIEFLAEAEKAKQMMDDLDDVEGSKDDQDK
ncbi:MAG: hypothetical protein GXP63_04170 [DPANN group archaeon]|nr:hypothetical protein [DPANN group archaeon]